MKTFNIGDTIVHKTLGKGTVIYTEEAKNTFGNPIYYFDVHFDNDPKYHVRQFSEESIVPFLVEHVPGKDEEEYFETEN